MTARRNGYDEKGMIVLRRNNRNKCDINFAQIGSSASASALVPPEALVAQTLHSSAGGATPTAPTTTPCFPLTFQEKHRTEQGLQLVWQHWKRWLGKYGIEPAPLFLQHDGQEEGISSTVAGVSRNFEISGSTSMPTLQQGLAPYDDLQKLLIP